MEKSNSTLTLPYWQIKSRIISELAPYCSIRPELSEAFVMKNYYCINFNGLIIILMLWLTIVLWIVSDETKQLSENLRTTLIWSVRDSVSGLHLYLTGRENQSFNTETLNLMSIAGSSNTISLFLNDFACLFTDVVCIRSESKRVIDIELAFVSGDYFSHDNG